MPHLMQHGVGYINPIGSDRTDESHYWRVVYEYLDFVRRASALDHFAREVAGLDQFTGKSVWDSASGRHFAFITDTNIILEYQDQFDFGTPWYKSRGDVSPAE